MIRNSKDPRPSVGGFSLVEVIIALMILTVGILGLAGTTAFVVRQVNMADVSTDRSNARQSVLERIRAMDYDSLASGSDSIGRYAMSWRVTVDGTSKVVAVAITGPGMKSVPGTMPALGNAVTDTFTYRVLKP